MVEVPDVTTTSGLAPDRRTCANGPWLANFGAIELNPWTSSVRAPHEPTWALIDVDPGTKTTWDELVVLARLYRTALEHLGVVGQPKVTGKRGIQIWVAVATGCSFDATRGWSSRSPGRSAGSSPSSCRGSG